jgi:hypothetical protein
MPINDSFGHPHLKNDSKKYEPVYNKKSERNSTQNIQEAIYAVFYICSSDNYIKKPN